MKTALFVKLSEDYLADGEYLSPNTKRNYKIALANLLEFANGRRLSDKLIYAWTDYLIQDGYQISTVHLMRREMAVFFRWAMRQPAGVLTQQYVEKIRNFPISTKPKIWRVISPVEYQKLLEYPYKPNDFWWPEMIRLAWETGLRLGDCAMLRKDSVDLSEMTIHLIPGKTKRLGKALDLPLSVPMTEILRVRIGAIVPDKLCRSAFSFIWPVAANFYECNHGRANMSATFYRLAVKCGLRCPQFHALRHSRVTTMLEAGESTAMVRSMTGHSLKTLQTYMDHISVESKRAACDRVNEKIKLQTL